MRRQIKSEVEQHEVGGLLFDEFPVSRLVLCRSDDLSFRDVGTDNAKGAFEFEGHILNDDDFKILHI